MANYSASDLRGGSKILIDGDPCAVVDNEFVKPGKGQAFNRIRIRNLRTGRTVEKTFRNSDSIESADVVDRPMQYLYADGEMWYFMDPETFEQIPASDTAVSEAKQWLREQDTCTVTLWNGVPLTVVPPMFVELKIVETDPGVRGDTSGGGGKPAKLETGATVRVPLFVGQDEIIKVDTRSGEYVGRVK
jgi:elongation factor P